MAHLSDDTRAAILAAASKLFAERSFDKVRMEDVALTAGIGKVTIYRYFPTKDDLYCKLLEGIGKEFLVELRKAEASVRGCRPRLVIILKEAQAFFAARGYLLDLLDRARLDPDLRKNFPWVDVQQQLFRTLQGLLAEGVARKEFEVDEPQAFDDLIALVHDLERRALVSRVAGDG